MIQLFFCQHFAYVLLGPEKMTEINLTLLLVKIEIFFVKTNNFRSQKVHALQEVICLIFRLEFFFNPFIYGILQKWQVGLVTF